MSVMESWTQTSWRLRNDDGSETAATWVAATNTSAALALDTNYRVRILITGAHTGGSGSFDFTGGFQYRVNGGTWTNITTTSTNVRAFASADTSWTITDNDATTEQLAGSATFVAGKMDETGTCTAVSISESQESEFELVFQLRSADLAGTETIDIRMVDSGTALSVYTATPSMTINTGGGSVTIPGTELLDYGGVLTGKAPTVAWSIDPGKGTLTLAGKTPERVTNETVTPAIAQLGLSGQPPDITGSYSFTIPYVSLRLVTQRGLWLDGHTPSFEVSGGTNHTATWGSASALTLAGQAPTANVTHSADPARIALALAGKVPTAGVTHSADPARVALALAGKVPTANVIHSADPARLSLAFAGKTPTANVTHSADPARLALALTGQEPAFSSTASALPTEADLTLAGKTPTAGVTHSAAPAKADLTLAGQAPSVGGDLTFDPAEVDLTLTGQAPTAGVTHSAAPTEADLTLAGKTPGVAWSIDPAVGALALAGKTPAANITHSADPAAAGLALAGKAPEILSANAFSPPAVALTFTGQAPTANVTHSADPAAATLTLAGKTPALVGSSSVESAAGALALSGQPPSIDASRSISVPPGALNLVTWRGLKLTGLTPTISIGSTGVSFDPAEASLTLAGQAPAALSADTYSPAEADLVLAGQVPTVNLTHSAAPAIATITLAGQAPTANVTHSAAPAIATLTLAGQAPTANVTYSAAPAAAALTLAGQTPIVLAAGSVAPAEATLALAGQTPSLGTSSPTVQPAAGTLALAGTISESWTQPPINIPVGRCPLAFVGKAPSRAAGLLLWGYAPIPNLEGDFGPIKTPAHKALVLTSKTPTFVNTTPNPRQPGVTTRRLEGYNPVLEISQNTSPSSLGLNGKAPLSVMSHPKIPVGRCSLTIAGKAPVTTQESAVDNGTLMLSGKTPVRTVSNNLVAAPAAGAVTLAGKTPQLSTPQTRVMEPAVASLSINEQPLYTGRSVTPGRIRRRLNGKAPTAFVGINRTISVDQGTLNLSLGTAGDSVFSQVQILAKWNGADAATSYTELARSEPGVFFGNAQLDTAQFAEGTASLLTDGTGDAVTFGTDAADWAAYQIGSTDDATVESFVRFNTLPGVGVTYSIFNEAMQDAVNFQMEIRNNGGTYELRGRFGFGNFPAATITPSTGVWYHVAIQRRYDVSNTIVDLLFDGTRVGSVVSNNTPSDISGIPAVVGGYDDLSTSVFTLVHDGWIDASRLTVGTARYPDASTYTVPDADYPEAAATYAATEPTLNIGYAPEVPTNSALALTGQAPTVTYTDDHVVLPARVSRSLVGKQPTKGITFKALPTKASRNLVGKVPRMKLRRILRDGARTRIISLSTDYNVKMLYD